jgi:immune inhibitor A
MKKLMSVGVTSALVAGTLFTGTAGVQASAPTNVNASSVLASDQDLSGELDLAVLNDEKLIQALTQRGVINASASDAQKRQVLQAYLANKGKDNGVKGNDPLEVQVKKSDAAKQREFKDFNNGLLHGNGNKNGHLKGQPDPVKETAYNGAVREDKVLVLTVEYSDFPHNQLKADESDNYYSDYTLEHYEDMIFGANGVKGPQGQDFVSMKQYYLQQSGGTYTIDGKAYGWLKVPHTAAYYGADRSSGGHDNVSPGGSKQLVKDVYQAAVAAGIPLSDYDHLDPHDLDGDGNTMEPDGLVDSLMIIHSGMGQEAGGGSLGDNAIWSHRSAVFYDPDGLGKGTPGFYDYMVMPEDGATGVFSHEYGHNLGLPDEYDTIYSGAGEPVGYWSIMSGGSWAGTIPGTEPSGFSPWAKAFFQATIGGNWTNPTQVKWEDVTKNGTQFLLDQANSPLGQNNQAVQVNLPKKKLPINTPAAGTYEYWSGQQDEMDSSAVTSLDLTGKTSAQLEFDAWYDTEEQWDFAFVQVSTDNGATWKSLGNDHTRSDVVPEGYPTILNSMPGFTGNSNGWQKEAFDLSAYAGQKIQMRLRYATDWGSTLTGFFADNVKVTADNAVIFQDDAEGTSQFALNGGFEKSDGNKYADHYYLLEWRNHAGVDQGLAHIKRGNSIMSYDPGLVVWYVDPTQSENWTGVHPGDGFLGVVDSHLGKSMNWSTGDVASTRYQIHDAAFGLNPTSPLALDYGYQTLNAPSEAGASLFDDSKSFLNPFLPDAGRAINSYGLNVRVNGQAADKSVGAVVVYKK